VLVGVFVCGGCGAFPSTDPNALLRFLAGNPDSGQDTVTIRLANQSTVYTVRLTVRFDGDSEDIREYKCDADEGTCDFILPSIPTMIEGLAETRWDEDNIYRGGTNMALQPGFTFTTEDYGPGSVILFQLGGDDVEASVL
jgi:hypothetical protein